MNADPGAGNGDGEELASGRAALESWIRQGTVAPLNRWLERALDRDGVPRYLPAAAWTKLLAMLDQARRARPDDWPERLDARIEGLLLATLRFTRAGGAAVFTHPKTRSALEAPDVFRSWAQQLVEPGLETVLDWWFPRTGAASRRAGVRAAPPLPAWSSAGGTLAILRANWSGQGDFLAIDQRTRGATAQFELTGLGHVWLGPTWTAEHEPALQEGSAAAPAAPARPRVWLSNSQADLAEWSFRCGRIRVIRTAVLLRGRRIALLADQVEAPAGTGAAWKIAIPAGVQAAPLSGGPVWVLAERHGSPSARVVPLGLSPLAGVTERGTLAREGTDLILRQPCPGRRCWLPLLASWDPLRNRQTIRWRVLTVAEKSRACLPETAFAARVSWGKDETLLVYRSLARPACRSVLGYQTSARFLVAFFGRDGNVTPIVKVD
jgi:hypothetical protein